MQEMNLIQVLFFILLVVFILGPFYIAMEYDGKYSNSPWLVVLLFGWIVLAGIASALCR
jgi:hypothetical protein